METLEARKNGTRVKPSKPSRLPAEDVAPVVVKKMTAPKGKAASTVITIPGPKTETLLLKLVGTSPLIVHRWSEKAIGMINDKKQGKARGKREAHVPADEYESSMYRMSKGKYGFPVIAFKCAAVDACSYIEGVTKVLVRGAIRVLPEEGDLVQIHGEPRMREDMVRVGMGQADSRYRAEFREWYVNLPVEYLANVISRDNVANLFQYAGLCVGVGEWRKQCNGEMGCFRVG
mgnify:CR=1 FL=1